MIRSILQLWALSLMGSVMLVAAAERWPQPLQPQPLVVAALVLTPPLLMLLWLLLRWRLPEPPDSGAGERGESQHSE